MYFIDSAKAFLIKLSDFIRYKKSYSQDGEDVVLQSFFEDKKNYKGTYVDIGAHHPIRFSNTRSFYNRGWSGINIDPTPGSMTPFNLLRSRDINLEIGIGKAPGELIFYCFNEPALNTFDKALADLRSKTSKYKITKKINVKIETLETVLRDHLPPKTNIDFFTIDVEGLDLDVLLSNDWNNYSPNYILVEDTDFKWNYPEKSDIYNFLSNKGYEIISILKRTVIYKKGIPY